jgi:hypothetical protein
MKPRPNVQLQALATLVLSLAALGALGRHCALVLALTFTVAEVIWAWMAVRYWVLRRRWEHGDPDARPHSSVRTALDKVMSRNNAIGILVPGTLSWLILLAGKDSQLYTPPVNGTTEVIVAACVVLVPLSMLVSSSVDWYLIRAFREGVVGEPACRPSVAESEASINHLKYWVMHRLVCEFVLWSSVAVGIGFISALVENATSDPTSKATFNLLGFIGIAAWSAGELAKLRAAVDFIRYPSVGIGQWVTGRNQSCDTIAGYVHDVALQPGVQLIDTPRGNPAPDISISHHSVPLRLRETLTRATPREPSRCATKCEFWVPACEVGLRALDASRAGVTSSQAGDSQRGPGDP